MSKPLPRIPSPRMAVSRKVAARALGVSVNTVDRIILRGDLKAKKLGGRVIIPIAEIERYLAALPVVGEPAEIAP
jgi:excisionase family DNA binding protein